MISFQLKDVYDMDMSVENIEKRWLTLRDMFNREEKKKKLPPSGSGISENKEWYLYRPLLFLSSHIAHRKTKTSLIRKPMKGSSLQPVHFKQACFQVVQPSEECEATVENEISQELCGNSSQIDDTCDESQIIDNDTQFYPVSIKRPLSSCSNSSSSLLSTSTNSLISPMKPISKTIVPPMDNFAQRKKKKIAHLDDQLAQAGTAISEAMNTVSTLITSTANKNKETDGYMLAIEGLKHIPGKNKTVCIIEMLQIIAKYEIRE